MIDPISMVGVFRRLCLEAGEIVMKFYELGNFDITVKEDNSPVTLADKEADKHISKGIMEHFSKIALVTEEQAQTHKIKNDSRLLSLKSILLLTN